ncbi:hypothetical protein BAUCODRAFT_329437 [Baudoinia panamericana UAMH 10762]|uniref:Ubiquitin-like domain-containing protein n=1 Tax=Baudoinia panamericana (strain UAMH 10762) TaxID=717646 RepID=M2M4E3_BAUPA|nr:uncharacterized protein BAUCODRAFT_329437 [Baudoinia panamericana UAMH 10762]EMC91456.1 hypothetical protein BAUCODRAFT_329437 [Baudoinia panamericana UAMH 10762]
MTESADRGEAVPVTTAGTPPPSDQRITLIIRYETEDTKLIVNKVYQRWDHVLEEYEDRTGISRYTVNSVLLNGGLLPRGVAAYDISLQDLGIVDGAIILADPISTGAEPKRITVLFSDYDAEENLPIYISAQATFFDLLKDFGGVSAVRSVEDNIYKCYPPYSSYIHNAEEPSGRFIMKGTERDRLGMQLNELHTTDNIEIVVEPTYYNFEITIRDTMNREVNLTASNTTTLLGLEDMYCGETGIAAGTVEFTLFGRALYISDDKLCEITGIKDHSVLEAAPKAERGSNSGWEVDLATGR